MEIRKESQILHVTCSGSGLKVSMVPKWALKQHGYGCISLDPLKKNITRLYFDGHERSDVEYRHDFVSYMAGINRRCKYDSNYPELDQNEKLIIIVNHDESTFYANADQSRYWGDDYNTVLKQKSLGQSIMISDFIEEATGDFHCHHDEKDRKLVETQHDGYFNSEQFLEQVDTAIDIFEAKFPNSQGLFLFDNAPIHKKYPDDALNADHMKRPSRR